MGHGHDHRSVAEAFHLVERELMIKAMELTLDVVLHFVLLTWGVDPVVNATLVILPSSVLGVSLSFLQKFFRVKGTHRKSWGGGWWLGKDFF